MIGWLKNVLWQVLTFCLRNIVILWPFSVLRQFITRNLGKPGNTALERYFMTTLLESANKDDEILAIRKCDIQASDQVLEVGFGPGLGLQYAATLITKSAGGKVHGVDYSQSMVDVAGSKLEKEIQDGLVELHHGSVDSLSFNDQAFDRIYHCNVYYFWEDRVGCCKELLRVLRPGGLMITVLDKPGIASAVSLGLLKSIDVNVDTYVAALREAGFVDVEIKDNYVKGKLFSCIYARSKHE